jgi:hypothetical protein
MTDFDFVIDTSRGTISNQATGNSRPIAEKFVIATGRMTADGTNALAKTKDGVFYTPVCTYENGVLCSVNKEELFSGDGKQRISLPACTTLPTRRHIVLPTMVNNANPEGPKYINLIAFGVNAMMLARTTKGSSVTVIGEPDECVVGKERFKVLFVKALLHNRKGGIKDEL